MIRKVVNRFLSILKRPPHLSVLSFVGIVEVVGASHAHVARAVLVHVLEMLPVLKLEPPVMFCLRKQMDSGSCSPFVPSHGVSSASFLLVFLSD